MPLTNGKINNQKNRPDFGRAKQKENKMTTAQELAKKDYADATNEATNIAVDTDQDCETETTIFYFKDGSELKACSIDYSLKAK